MVTPRLTTVMSGGPLAPLTSYRSTRRVNCPEPTCHGHVQVLVAPEGFEDRRVPVRCQTCDQRYTYERGDGVTDILCPECDAPCDDAFAFRRHRIAKHDAGLAYHTPEWWASSIDPPILPEQ